MSGEQPIWREGLFHQLDLHTSRVQCVWLGAGLERAVVMSASSYTQVVFSVSG